MQVLLVCALLLATGHAQQLSNEKKACYEKQFATNIVGNGWASNITLCIYADIPRNNQGPLLTKTRRHVDYVWFDLCKKTTCTKPQVRSILRSVNKVIDALKDLMKHLPKCDVVRDTVADLETISSCESK